MLKNTILAQAPTNIPRGIARHQLETPPMPPPKTVDLWTNETGERSTREIPLDDVRAERARENIGRGQSEEGEEEVRVPPSSMSVTESEPPEAQRCGSCQGRNWGIICLDCGTVHRVCCMPVVTCLISPEGEPSYFGHRPCNNCSDMDAYFQGGNVWKLTSVIRPYYKNAFIANRFPQPEDFCEHIWEPVD